MVKNSRTQTKQNTLFIQIKYAILNLQERSYKMLKQYYVEYWNQRGQKVGMNISAQSALDAKIYAESLPEFKCMVNYPTAV